MSQVFEGAVLEALPLPVVAVGRDGRILMVNGAAEPFFGTSRSHLVGVALDRIVDVDSPLLGMVRRVRESGCDLTEHALTVRGRRFSHEALTVQGTVLADEPGAVVLTFHDGARVAVFARQTEFRSGARSVAGLAGVLARGVTTPLASIRGAAQVLEESVCEADRELATLIREEADRIHGLIEELAAFGSVETVWRPVNVHRVLEEARREAQEGFAAPLRIVEAYDPSLPPVRGQKDHLTRMVVALLRNAAEAVVSNGGQGVLTLRTRFDQGVGLSSPGARALGTRDRAALPLTISVEDDGGGVAEAVRAGVFEPFVTGKPGHAGLGLALVAKIVDDHGGLIDWESRPGRTVFTIYLPMFSEDESPF